jgi:zona occludens toxin (predicted ATPase)
MQSGSCLMLLQEAGNLVLRVSSRLPRYSDQYTLVLDNKENHTPTIHLWRQPETRYVLTSEPTFSLFLFIASKQIQADL